MEITECHRLIAFCAIVRLLVDSNELHAPKFENYTTSSEIC
jgi:hypothetical protein